MTTRSARACPSGGDATARRVTLVIPGTPAYSLSPNARCHWAVKQRESRDAKWALRFVDCYVSDYDLSDRPVALHWTVYLAKGGKQRDLDNILPCLKPYQDALVAHGHIGGDSPRWIPETPTVEQIVWSKHKGEPRIEVTIEEAA